MAKLLWIAFDAADAPAGAAFAKALGNEMSRPTLVLDVGSLMGSLVGQTEANIRQALRIIDAMAPAVCFLDECEKAFSGVAASGQTDSGVSARLFGTFLAWLNDHETDVFVVATANDIAKLPPEFSRAERFDGVFFLDLPDTDQRRAIWKIYIDHYRLEPTQKVPADETWTGAEIKAAAIAQGAHIQQNFILQEELPNGTSRVIGDDDQVHLREHLRFTAIAPDDNS